MALTDVRPEMLEHMLPGAASGSYWLGIKVRALRLLQEMERYFFSSVNYLLCPAE